MSSFETLPGVFRSFLRFSLVFFTLSVCLVAGQTVKYLLQGQTVSFFPDINGKPDEILWKHKGNKIVEFDGSEQKAFGSYEHRVTLGWHSADLTISNLRYEDSGLYELETYINKKLDRKQYQLEVIDKVAKPEISCKIINKTTEKSGGQANLICSLPSSYSKSSLKFQWSSKTISHHGPDIIISLGDDHDDHIYNCTVSNPLSKESAMFQAKDCYPDGESNSGVIVGSVIGSLLVIIFICLLLWILYKKGCFKNGKKSDIENHSTHEETSHLMKHRKGFHGDSWSDSIKKGPQRTEEETLRLMAERKKRIDGDSSSDQEQNKNQESKMSDPSVTPDKPLRTNSDSHAKENNKALEVGPKGREEKERSDDNCSDSGSAEHDDKTKTDADVLENRIGEEEGDPADSEKKVESLADMSDHKNEKEEAEGGGISSVPQPDSDDPRLDATKALDIESTENEQNMVLDPAESEKTNTSPDVSDHKVQTDADFLESEIEGQEGNPEMTEESLPNMSDLRNLGQRRSIRQHDDFLRYMEKRKKMVDGNSSTDEKAKTDADVLENKIGEEEGDPADSENRIKSLAKMSDRKNVKEEAEEGGGISSLPQPDPDNTRSDATKTSNHQNIKSTENDQNNDLDPVEFEKTNTSPDVSNKGEEEKP